MSVYELGIDEAVILQDSNVSTEGLTKTLILTNRNIIQVNRGFFGGDKDASKYPLLKLKELNGKPNVRIGKSRNGSPQLELYFQGYEKIYSFQGGLFAERKWANAIEKAYKAAVNETRKAEKAKKTAGEIFAPLKATIENAKTVFSPKTKEPKTVVLKCPKCGAELVGIKGEQVKCSYCEALVTIK